MNKNTTHLLLKNRAFRYGDALFETIRVFDTKMPFLSLHYERLMRGMTVLRFRQPTFFTFSFFKKTILENLNTPNAKVRFVVFRQGKGLYTPETNDIDFCLEVVPLTQNQFLWNENFLSYSVFSEVRISCDVLANLKTANALPYVMASIFKKEQQKDECLLLNQYGRLCEATSSNVFLQVSENELITPDLSEGCLDGVMRRFLIKNLKKWGWNISKQSVELADLENALEVFISNSIQGVRPLVTTTQHSKTAKAIQKKLNDFVQNF